MQTDWRASVCGECKVSGRPGRLHSKPMHNMGAPIRPTYPYSQGYYQYDTEADRPCLVTQCHWPSPSYSAPCALSAACLLATLLCFAGKGLPGVLGLHAKHSSRLLV